MSEARFNGAIGARTWAIAEGYIPSASTGEGPALESHEAACMLNAGAEPATVEVTVYFSDRNPVGPYRLTVPARRTPHRRRGGPRRLPVPARPAPAMRSTGPTAREPIPRDPSYAAVIDAGQPI